MTSASLAAAGYAALTALLFLACGRAERDTASREPNAGRTGEGGTGTGTTGGVGGTSMGGGEGGADDSGGIGGTADSGGTNGAAGSAAGGGFAGAAGVGGGLGGNGGTGAGVGGDAGSGAGAAGAAGAAAGAGGSGTTMPSEWAMWPMPNSPNSVVNPHSYTDRGDGTVLDNVTGLVWQQTADAGRFERDGAKQHCQDLTLAGGGWRLPTVIELVSIVDVVRADPAIDPIFAGPSEYFWTSSVQARTPNLYAWTIHFRSGHSEYADYRQLFRARCVKGTIVPTTPHYEEVTFGEILAVKDNWTGLTWLKYVDGIDYDISAAASYCQARGEGWRLPSLQELQTLVDRVRTNPTIDPTFFPQAPTISGCTLSVDALDTTSPTNQWTVDFYYGTARIVEPERTCRPRCVRL